MACCEDGFQVDFAVFSIPLHVDKAYFGFIVFPVQLHCKHSRTRGVRVRSDEGNSLLSEVFEGQGRTFKSEEVCVACELRAWYDLACIFFPKRRFPFEKIRFVKRIHVFPLGELGKALSSAREGFVDDGLS